MDTPPRMIEYDGGIDCFFVFRTQLDSMEGTVWRFIADRERGTVVVTPYQSANKPAPPRVPLPSSH